MTPLIRRAYAGSLVLALGCAACSPDSGSPGGPWGPGNDYPRCPSSGPLYHTAPISPVDPLLRGIEPLGHIIVPGHTWPSDHVYFLVGGTGPSVEVRAPGSVRVWQIALTGHKYNNDSRGYYEDYSLRFSPCREVQGFFHHVTELAHPALLAAAKGPWDRCDEFTQDNGEFQRYCQRAVRIDVEEGAILGRSGTLDVGAYDARVAPLPFVNSARQQTDSFNSWDYAHVVCPFDAYDDTTRAALMAKLGQQDASKNPPEFVPRTGEPLCGTIMQDVPDTLQGIWATDLYKQPSDTSEQLTFAHDNFDTSYAVLASGGGSLGIHYRKFKPEVEGLIDRDPSLVTGESTFCYRLDGPGGARGRILTRLTMNATVLVEAQETKTCDDVPYVLSDRAVTYRR